MISNFSFIGLLLLLPSRKGILKNGSIFGATLISERLVDWFVSSRLVLASSVLNKNRENKMKAGVVDQRARYFYSVEYNQLINMKCLPMVRAATLTGS